MKARMRKAKIHQKKFSKNIAKNDTTIHRQNHRMKPVKTNAK
jgi:hypothetical protein